MKNFKPDYLLACLFMLIGVYSYGQNIDSTSYEYIKIGYTHDFFSGPVSDWKNGIVELKFQKNTWSFLPRITAAERFDQFGLLFEADAYKTLQNGDYLNLNGGVSTSDIFVRASAGAEYYNPFGKWEHSVGLRWMNYANTGNLGVLTTSLSKYYGSHLTILRLTGAYGLESNDFVNYAIILNQRYYLGDSEYIGITGAYGYDPSLLIIGDQAGVNGSNPDQFSLGLTYKSDTKNRKDWSIGYGWTHYNFVNFERDQHSLIFFLTIHERTP